MLYEASSDDGVGNMASQGVIYLVIYFPNGKLTLVSCNCWEALCVPDVSGELKDFHFLLVPFKQSSQPVQPLLTGVLFKLWTGLLLGDVKTPARR